MFLLQRLVSNSTNLPERTLTCGRRAPAWRRLAGQSAARGEARPKALVAPNVPLRIALDADEKGATDFLSAIAPASRP
jgi:hypothetical protein